MPVELCVTLWAPALGRLYRREKKEVRMQSKIDLKPLLERTSTCGIKPCRVLVNCGCNNEEKTEGSMNGDDSLERHHFGGKKDTKEGKNGLRKLGDKGKKKPKGCNFSPVIKKRNRQTGGHTTSYNPIPK